MEQIKKELLVVLQEIESKITANEVLNEDDVLTIFISSMAEEEGL